MTRLQSLIKEVLSQPKKKDCGCGCNDCGGKAPILTEGKVKHLISEGLQYHMDKKIQLHESVFRIGSEKHFELIREARALWVRGIIDVSEDDQAILETNLGHFGMYEGEAVPLDMPMVNEEDNRKHALLRVEPRNYEAMIDKLQDMNINHRRESDTVIKVYTDNLSDKALYNLTHDVYVDKFVLKEAKKKKKKDPPIGKPKRGGPKAYYVYVRDPKTKRIKKITFGSGGLKAKIRNPKARKAFAARHRCKTANDRTTARYWSCRLPRYAKLLGLGSNMNTFW